MADVHFPQARVIRVVQDNLNAHTPWSLYAAHVKANRQFSIADARAELKRLYPS